MRAQGASLATRVERSPRLPDPAPAELRQIWRWNHARNALQQKLGNHVFVPAIVFIQYRGRLCSATIWTDGIPVVLPKSDVVLLYRDELALRQWFKKQPGIAVATWDSVLGKIGDRRTETDPLLHHFVDDAERPRSIAQWITSLPAGDTIEGVSMDKVLDAELGTDESTLAN